MANQRRQDDAAKAWLLDALARDPDCARASLLLGRLSIRASDHQAAIVALQVVE